MHNPYEACAGGMQQLLLSAAEAQVLEDVRGPHLDEDGVFAHAVGSASMQR